MRGEVLREFVRGVGVLLVCAITVQDAGGCCYPFWGGFS